MTTHHFSTTGDAYDACQCGAEIKSGDTLVVASERVVGVACTWPFAATAELGVVHGNQPQFSDALLAFFYAD